MKLLLPGRSKRLLFQSFIVIGVLLFATISVYAAQVTLAWDPNAVAPDGYRVFQRATGSSYNYSSPAWSGSGATATLNNLTPDTTYYFVVRAYAGTVESANSAEVSYRYVTPTYQITASAGANGTISPSGAVSVTQGANRSFTITPNTGYRVADVLVDGRSVGAVTTYTFSNVTANHTIAASFATNGYTITATAGQNGAISPSGQVSVAHGASRTFTITPNANCYIANVVVNGQSVGPVSTYTFTNVTANGTIAASFGVQTHTISASAGTGGSINPAGSISVAHGGSRSFSISAQTNYRIRAVLVDGASVGSVASYTFSNVTRNHSIAASFESTTNDDTGSGESGEVVFGDTPGADHPGTVQDTFININTAVNFSSTVLNTYTWPANTPSNAILMKFDLSKLPAGAKIQSATLKLYQTSAGGDASYDVSAHKIINKNPDLRAANGYTYDGVNNWTANNRSYNNVPLAQADIAAAENVNKLDLSNGYKSWDISGMVQSWIDNPAANFGLLLNSSAAAGRDSYRFFASSSASNAGTRPVLEISFGESAPEPVSVVFGNAPDVDHQGTLQDTFLNINTGNNFSSTQLNTYTWPANTPANAVLMKFDLSKLPAGAKIKSATLTLYQTQAGGDAAYDVSVHRIINRNPDLRTATGYTYNGVNNWTASNRSYNNVPLAQADIAPADDVTVLDRSAGYRNWDVTKMVQAWVNGSAPNYGLLLNSAAVAAADSYRFFASSGAADTARRPTLEVTYSVD